MKHPGHHQREKAGAGFVTGLLIMAAGVAFLLGRFEIVDFGPIWRYWPLILVAFGLDKIIRAESSKERGEGVWLAFIGTWLLISFVHVFGMTFATSWPILLIGFGIGMIYKAFVRRNAGGIDMEVEHEK